MTHYADWGGEVDGDRQSEQYPQYPLYDECDQAEKVWEVTNDT